MAKQVVGQRLDLLLSSVNRANPSLQEAFHRLARRQIDELAPNVAGQVAEAVKIYRTTLSKSLSYDLPPIYERAVEDILWHYQHASENVNLVSVNQRHLAVALSEFGSLKALPILREQFLNDNSMDWPYLLKVGDRSYLPRLEKYLDPPTEEKIESVDGLLLETGAPVFPLLGRLAAHADPRIQGRAIYLLVQIEDPMAIPVLKEAIKSAPSDQTESLKWSLLRLQCRFVDRIYTPPVLASFDRTLVQYLCSSAFNYPSSDIDFAASQRAADVLVKIGGAATGEVENRVQHHYVIFDTDDPNFEVERATETLARMGEAGLPPLLYTLTSSEAPSREIAAQTLQLLTGQPFGPDYAAWSRWYLRQKARGGFALHTAAVQRRSREERRKEDAQWAEHQKVQERIRADKALMRKHHIPPFPAKPPLASPPPPR